MKVKQTWGGGGHRGVTCGLGGKEKEGGEGVKMGRGTLEERLRALARRKSRLGWSPSLRDLREPVSLATVPAGDKQQTEHQNTEGARRGHHGRGRQAKPQRPGWQEGEAEWR